MKKFLALALLAIGLLSFQRISADGPNEEPRITKCPQEKVIVYEGDRARIDFDFIPAEGVAIYLFERGQRVTPAWMMWHNATLSIDRGRCVFIMDPAILGTYQLSFLLANDLGEVRVNTLIDVVEEKKSE